MFFQLSPEQDSWVRNVLDSMTVEEKVAQLLHPNDRNYTLQELEELFSKVPCGAFFTGINTPEQLVKRHKVIQKASKFPVAISADMERGLDFIAGRGTSYPYQMALGACNNSEYAYTMGKVTARQSRAVGIHWTFSPVCDLNLNPENPIDNVRALGDDPERVIPLLGALIRGLQEDNLMAATCKHFPGDGVDNRDQHMCVSVNSLPYDQWMELYGKVWKACIAFGAKSIMCGHISLPDFQRDYDDIDEALPATLSARLTTELLREKLNFRGVVVSDAYPMVGFTCRFPECELAWRNIASGSDSVLFSNPVKDYQWLLEALKTGKLSEERVHESARRMLELKASLNLHLDCFGPAVDDEQFKKDCESAQRVADDSVTVLKASRLNNIPVLPETSPKILTVSLIRADNILQDCELSVFDSELRKRGFAVTHVNNPDDKYMKNAMNQYDRIIISVVIAGHAGLQTRLTRLAMLVFWHSFFTQVPEKMIYCSFGSPYVLYDHPFFEHCYCFWGHTYPSQLSAAKFLTGEITAKGVLPVRQYKKKIRKWEF